MKTSFYFVLWILIYPILGLFNNAYIENNAFIVALIAVFGISWLLNKMMPYILGYDRVSEIAPILEDIYTGNVKSFSKRLSGEATVECIYAIYLTITAIVIAISIFKFGIEDWIALVIFGFFAIGSISKAIKLLKAKFDLKSNPSPEQCMQIAENVYELNYESYYEEHQNKTYTEMLPPRPKYFKVFQIFSLIVAILSTLFGLWFIINGIAIIFHSQSIEYGAVAGMYFFYGSLATYFGIKDLVSIIQSLRSNRQKFLPQPVVINE